MDEKREPKGRPTRRRAAKDLRTRRLRDGQADAVKGGLLPAMTSPETRRAKNEVAIETLEIAHVGQLPSPG